MILLPSAAQILKSLPVILVTLVRMWLSIFHVFQEWDDNWFKTNRKSLYYVLYKCKTKSSLRHGINWDIVAIEKNASQSQLLLSQQEFSKQQQHQALNSLKHATQKLPFFYLFMEGETIT